MMNSILGFMVVHLFWIKVLHLNNKHFNERVQDERKSKVQKH